MGCGSSHNTTRTVHCQNILAININACRLSKSARGGEVRGRGECGCQHIEEKRNVNLGNTISSSS